jgi:hypothetical protein
MRIRIHERRRDDAYFAHVADQLRQCPGVRDVIVTPLTGSVLVLHEATDTTVIGDYARALDLFEVAAPSPTGVSHEPLPDELIRTGLGRVDTWMRRESGDGADLRSMALIGLLGAAVWQFARGEMLPAGATLLWYALTLTRERQGVGRGFEGPPEPVDSERREADEHRAKR